MRKRRRADALKDKNDRIRMGLLPPDPPKGTTTSVYPRATHILTALLRPVRIANLMKVLTSDAIQDPTRVEARVRREVAVRKHNHEKMNSERKLTDEQRREKIETKKAEEDNKGIHAQVYKYVHLFSLPEYHPTDSAASPRRIKTLTDPAHQFKVRMNAEQNNLSGVCIFNPQFNMVYVEGAAKFLKRYKRLMTERIAWTEKARPRAGADDVEIDDENGDAGGSGGADAEGGAPAVAEASSSTVKPEEGNEATSLENNRCWLVWEGEVRDRAFSAFRGKQCPTDRDAKEVLGEKLRGYWDMAKNWKPEEEELF